VIAVGIQAERNGPGAELRGGDHQIATGGEAGPGGDLIFFRDAEVIAQPPTAEVDGGAAGVVEFEPVLIAGDGIGEGFIDDDGRGQPVGRFRRGGGGEGGEGDAAIREPALGNIRRLGAEIDDVQIGGAVGGGEHDAFAGGRELEIAGIAAGDGAVGQEAGETASANEGKRGDLGDGGAGGIV